MLNILTIINDHFDSRAYAVWRTGRREALVVDPADAESGAVAAALETRGLSAEYILLTHEHFDHMAGAEPLRQRHGARLVCSRACSEAIARPGQNFSRYLIGKDVECRPADLLCEEIGNALEGGGARAEFIATPGHSPGGVCIALEGALFTGDTLIHNLRTVTKLPGGDRESLRASIDLLLARFPAATMVYPGHGEPFELGRADRDVILGRLRA